MRLPNVVCTACGQAEWVVKYDYKGDSRVICERCGAVEDSNGKFVKKCQTCLKETDELFGLFVPHLCHECYGDLRVKQIKEGSVCRMCRLPYIDCSC